MAERTRHLAIALKNRQSLRVEDAPAPPSRPHEDLAADDLRRFMPLLERSRTQSGLDDETATRLVAFVFELPWPDYWVSRALDWIDDGVPADGLDEQIRKVSQDKAYSHALATARGSG